MVTLCACVIVLGDVAPAHAARPVGLQEQPAGDQRLKRYRSGTSVQQVQKALAEMGYYLGSIDGHLNSETEAAIRFYQKSIGLKIDGQISRELWDMLNNAVQVRSLLKRLSKVRKSGKDKARAALLGNEATRDLIQNVDDERAGKSVV